jgi:hypothetical protein
MSDSDGRPVGRPPHQHAHTWDDTFEPGDEIPGGWSLEQLLRMNERFVERVERAFARGLETHPGETADGTHRRQERAIQMNGGDDPICIRCGDSFVPIRGGNQQKYCSHHCRELAYLKRCALAKSP